PAALFLRRPAVHWRNLAAYGLFIGVGQFGVLYVAMDGHISPGLASLVIQVQVFFTIGLAMKLSGERVHIYQWCALLIAAAGIGVTVAHADRSTTARGLAMTLIAAMAWACGNIAVTKAGTVNMLSYVVWASAYAIPPLIVLSLIFEGWGRIASSLQHA